jgi:NAD(P)H-dependent flavin oxidoreductase YrpB (nitropropane dioxygenase family)
MLMTPFTEQVGCKVALQQAGMGMVSTPELAAAVAEAGAVGTLALPMASPTVVADALQRAKSRTTGAVGINFLMPFLSRDCVEVAAEQVRIVEFFYGEPDASLVTLVHQGGALAAWQVGSELEARQAADAGCDLVIAQGMEAGGHVRGTSALFDLLDQVLDAVNVPVVAAGGIGTARMMAAALAAGAAAVRVGTRFLAASESDVHPEYLQRLVAAEAQDTVLTEHFSVMWPDAPHRVLRSCIEASLAHSGDSVGEISAEGVPMAIPNRSALCPNRATSGTIEAMALYAGASVGSVRGELPAADIVRELAEGAEALLQRSRPS